MRILSIVGARPEFIQAWPVSLALHDDHEEILVHTGQHYDYQMSQSFFDQLEIQEPNYNLDVGSGSHGIQTGEMLARLETVMLEESPDVVIVRGDTNSTLAGALAASKLNIPVVHIEAGERSYRRDMPEEINRIVADQLASLHLCASKTAITRLKQEGIEGSAFWVGDVMLDAIERIRPIARETSRILEDLDLNPQTYCLLTLHRAANTDDDARLSKLVDLINRLDERIVFPVHPRTQKSLRRIDALFNSHVITTEPMSYFDIVILEENARLIATDSGGVQREAYFARVPCLTLREETEWTETIEVGWNRLMGIEPEQVLAHWDTFEEPRTHPSLFGDGRAAERIVRLIDGWAKSGFSTPMERFVPDELLSLETVGVTQ